MESDGEAREGILGRAGKETFPEKPAFGLDINKMMGQAVAF